MKAQPTSTSTGCTRATSTTRRTRTRTGQSDHCGYRHIEGTDKFFAEVVTDKEIALAESPSTYEAFVVEYGEDYAVHTIPEKEKTAWVASYTGGFDWNAAAASDSAFEILWWPYAAQDIETWKPEAGS